MWRIHEQTTKPLVENQGKPDAIIRTVERYPMAVEVKIDYKRSLNETGEKQARERYLGKTLRKESPEMRASRRAQGRRLAGNNTGYGPDFVDLADRMLKRNGTMAFVLPATAITGNSWYKVRRLWAEEYHNIFVLTIADARSKNCTFSSHTTMAECLVVATKGKSSNTGRAMFICLRRCPDRELEALEVVKQIHSFKDIKSLEDGANMGNSICIGDDIVGFAISVSLPDGALAWPVSRIRDVTVLQSAYQLTNKQLRLPRQKTPIELPICSVSDIARIGADHRDIKDPSKRGAFEIIKGCPNTAEYPCLHHLDCETQRAIVVSPNAHGFIRPHAEAKARRILERTGRVQFNIDLGFSSHSLSVMFAEQDTIGIRSVRNVVFEDADYDYAWTLWSNSTLGFLCYYLSSGKQQGGRGSGSKASLESMSTLDVRQLSDEALANAKRIFNELKHQKMLPFNQMDADPVRYELDRLLLSEVLAITETERPDVHEGLALLRKMLCKEPSIHGGKKSKVKLDV